MLSVCVSLVCALSVQFSSSLAVAIFPIFNGQLAGTAMGFGWLPSSSHSSVKHLAFRITQIDSPLPNYTNQKWPE